jgi:pimeloyl-ACP methyl ester carboxylesterase
VSRPFLRRFLVGSARRDDEHFVGMLVRHGSNSRDRALSARAIVWANQPSWWRRILIVAVPGGEQTGFSIGRRVAELDGVPTLVLWGREDRVICATDARRLRERHRGAEIHIAQGVGHMLPLEAAAWTNGHIRRFCHQAETPLQRAA